MITPPEAGRAAATGSFPTTHWSVIVHAGTGSESQARAALESLCRSYWYPVYAFTRRQGRAHHEAEDCAQELFARLLSSGGIAKARPERGRFRSFLLASLQNFLTNEWHRNRAAKRGGGAPILSLDLERAEERFSNEPVASGLTPEEAYDRSWALGMIDTAIASLRVEYNESGRGALFSALAPLLSSGAADTSHGAAASSLGMSTHAFTVALHRLRCRMGARLRAIVAETVENPAEVDAELRHLIDTVRRGSR